MREIKFRAYEPKNKILFYYDEVDGRETMQFYFTEDGLLKAQVVVVAQDDDPFGSEFFQCEVMPFTGLKDKRGADIYDCDRLKRRIVQFETPISYIDVFYEVRWNGWCYGLCVADKQLYGLDPIVARECEVVGNIYENPERL